jgi:hypothetical protein
MNQLNNHRRALSALYEALFMVIAGAVKGQGKAEPSLAEQARDPTASVTAIAIRYDTITSFYNLSDAELSQVVVRPIIPWKWGKQRQISRLSLPYVTRAPDWGAATGLVRIVGTLGSGFNNYLRGSMVQSAGAQGVLTR